MEELGGVSETLLKLSQEYILYTLRFSLKNAVVETCNYAADTDVEKKVVKSGYLTGGIELTAESVSRNGKCIRAEGTNVKQAQCVFATDSSESDVKLETVLCC